MTYDDTMVCSRCGKDFPLSPDGESLLKAHMLAEKAIDKRLELWQAAEQLEATRQLSLSFDHQSRTGVDQVDDEELF